MMPARSSPRPRSSLRKRRRLPSASESSLLNLRLSLESTHQRSACTPSMSVEQIPDLMMTERKCMREAGKLSELNTLNLAGKRNTMNGARDLPEDSPSGLERDQARRRETQSPHEGGWEVVRAEHLESCWKEKYDEWSKRPSRRLPKWFGERPGKKKGDPETPEGGDEEEAAAAEEEYDEEEEEDEEEYAEEEE